MCLPRPLVIRTTKMHLNTRYKQGHRNMTTYQCPGNRIMEFTRMFCRKSKTVVIKGHKNAFAHPFLCSLFVCRKCYSVWLLLALMSPYVPCLHNAVDILRGKWGGGLHSMIYKGECSEQATVSLSLYIWKGTSYCASSYSTQLQAVIFFRDADMSSSMSQYSWFVFRMGAGLHGVTKWNPGFSYWYRPLWGSIKPH